MSLHWVHPFSEVLNTAVNKKCMGSTFPNCLCWTGLCWTGFTCVIQPRNYVGGEGSPYNQFDLGTRQAVPLSYSL